MSIIFAMLSIASLIGIFWASLCNDVQSFTGYLVALVLSMFGGFLAMNFKLTKR